MEAIWLVALLACPLLMGLMMFFMMRGMRRRDGGPKENGR